MLRLILFHEVLNAANEEEFTILLTEKLSYYHQRTQEAQGPKFPVLP